MDKPADQGKMTIKINGKEKSFADNGEITTKLQSAAASEQDKENFDWVLPEPVESLSETKKEVSDLSSVKKKAASFTFGSHLGKSSKLDRSFFLKAPVLALLFAVLCGTSLGYIVLKTITADEQTAATSPVQPIIPAGNSTSQAIPTLNGELTVYFVQGGVFSTEDSAKLVQQQVVEKGLPAEIFQVDGQFYLFLGVAGSLEESKQLAVFLKTYGVDVYWKEMAVKPASAEADEKEMKTISKLTSIYESLVKSSSGLLVGKTASATNETKAKEIEAIKAEAKEAADTNIITTANDLAASAELLRQYESSGEQAQLLLAQQKLLVFLQNYQKIGSE
jgi:stage II sporulation protein B